MSESIQLAVIGGSGFYEMPGLEDISDVMMSTPYGEPSSVIRVGTLEGLRVAFLARHGTGHTFLPAEIPQRANFWALKQLGVQRVLAVSAVGSLREDYAPGDIVIPDQLIDRTNANRPQTFFGNGIVAHVSLARPFCPVLAEQAQMASNSVTGRTRTGGTYVVIEGPAFGTRAESHLYRQWGASLVGMTALPEARLAREAELCYALLTAVTDYDSWHDGHEAVDAATVFKVLQQNVMTSQSIVRALAAQEPMGGCECARSLDSALVTAPAAIGPNVRERLAPILARRLAEAAPV